MTSVTDSDFVSWRLRTRSALARTLGEQHHITEAFNDIQWMGSIWADDAMHRSTFIGAEERAHGVLRAAIAEVEFLDDETPVADESGIDHELWEHVAPELRAEEWGKVARGAVVFTEDRIRKW